MMPGAWSKYSATAVADLRIRIPEIKMSREPEFTTSVTDETMNMLDDASPLNRLRLLYNRGLV